MDSKDNEVCSNKKQGHYTIVRAQFKGFAEALAASQTSTNKFIVTLRTVSKQPETASLPSQEQSNQNPMEHGSIIHMKADELRQRKAILNDLRLVLKTHSFTIAEKYILRRQTLEQQTRLHGGKETKSDCDAKDRCLKEHTHSYRHTPPIATAGQFYYVDMDYDPVALACNTDGVDVPQATKLYNDGQSFAYPRFFAGEEMPRRPLEDQETPRRPINRKQRSDVSRRILNERKKIKCPASCCCKKETSSSSESNHQSQEDSVSEPVIIPQSQQRHVYSTPDTPGGVSPAAEAGLSNELNSNNIPPRRVTSNRPSDYQTTPRRVLDPRQRCGARRRISDQDPQDPNNCASTLPVYSICDMTTEPRTVAGQDNKPTKGKSSYYCCISRNNSSSSTDYYRALNGKESQKTLAPQNQPVTFPARTQSPSAVSPASPLQNVKVPQRGTQLPPTRPPEMIGLNWEEYYQLIPPPKPPRKKRTQSPSSVSSGVSGIPAQNVIAPQTTTKVNSYRPPDGPVLNLEEYYRLRDAQRSQNPESPHRAPSRAPPNRTQSPSSVSSGISTNPPQNVIAPQMTSQINSYRPPEGPVLNLKEYYRLRNDRSQNPQAPQKPPRKGHREAPSTEAPIQDSSRRASSSTPMSAINPIPKPRRAHNLDKDIAPKPMVNPIPKPPRKHYTRTEQLERSPTMNSSPPPKPPRTSYRLTAGLSDTSIRGSRNRLPRRIVQARKARAANKSLGLTTRGRHWQANDEGERIAPNPPVQRLGPRVQQFAKQIIAEPNPQNNAKNACRKQLEAKHSSDDSDSNDEQPSQPSKIIATPPLIKMDSRIAHLESQTEIIRDELASMQNHLKEQEEQHRYQELTQKLQNMREVLSGMKEAHERSNRPATRKQSPTPEQQSSNTGGSENSQSARRNRLEGAVAPNQSSYCLYCATTRVPILKDNLWDSLIRLIAPHKPADVVLTVQLQHGNGLYHIHAAEWLTGKPLGCLLATDECIRDAKSKKVFEHFIPLYIVDTRNSSLQKNQIISLTNFEII